MKTIPTIALAVALAAPAAAADRCLFASQVNGFSKASRDSVVLSAGARDFLVTFATPCTGIEDAISVAAVAATGCFGSGDKVVFDDMGITQTCLARDVTEVPKAAKPPEAPPGKDEKSGG